MVKWKFYLKSWLELQWKMKVIHVFICWKILDGYEKYRNTNYSTEIRPQRFIEYNFYILVCVYIEYYCQEMWVKPFTWI